MWLANLVVALLCCQFTVEVVPSFTVEVKQLPPAQAVQKTYLAWFTASWCSPCKSWERTTKPNLESAGYVVVPVDMTDSANLKRYGKRISRLPSFVACDWATGEWMSEPVVGGIDLATAKWMLDGSKQISPKQADPFPPDPPAVSIYNGRNGSSHQNRESLIDHLANEGIHAGRHSLQQLNSMTDAQLDALHNADHSTMTVRPTHRIQRSRGFLGILFR